MCKSLRMSMSTNKKIWLLIALSLLLLNEIYPSFRDNILRVLVSKAYFNSSSTDSSAERLHQVLQATCKQSPELECEPKAWASNKSVIEAADRFFMGSLDPLIVIGEPAEIPATMLSTSGVNLNQMKQSLRKLENEQMTQPMSTQKEKKLIEIIKGIHLKIKEQEESLNKDPKLKKAVEEEKTLKQKAEKQHDLVEKMAKKAQEEHQAMIEILTQLDNFVKKTTAIQEKIVLTKIEADTVHKEFIENVNKIHDLEKMIIGVEKKKVVKKKIADVSAVQKEADDIFERFKNGEKLSTEDLMVLQKAGLL